MLQHDAVYVLGEFSKELGTKRLALFERAFDAAYAACNLCPASMAAAELLAGITLQLYYERAMLVRWGHAPPDADADEAVLKLALATDRVHVTCDMARQGTELRSETVIVVSHGKDERTVDPCMQVGAPAWGTGKGGGVCVWFSAEVETNTVCRSGTQQHDERVRRCPRRQPRHAMP